MNEEMKPYGVSYIASAPEELKVGDRVEVVDENDALYKQQGIVIDIQEDGDIYVKFHTSKHVKYKLSQLRKLPDVISFEEDSDNVKALKVGDRVEVCDLGDDLYGQKAVVENIADDYVAIKFSDGKSYEYYETQLVKLLDTDNPLDTQVGGSHYKKCKIEPAEYIHANGLDFFQGNVVKYITRFRDKDGKKDLEKIKHYCDMLIQLEYPEDK